MWRRPKPADIPEPEHDAGVRLSDEELEYVMGGLNRIWTPLADNQTGLPSPAPRQDPGGVADASAGKL